VATSAGDAMEGTLPLWSAAVDGFSEEGLDGLRARLQIHVDRGDVPGIVALVARGTDVHVEVLGSPALGDPAPLRRDAIFRIASLSKPIGAAGAMALVDDGVLALDDPVEQFVPGWQTGAYCGTSTGR
jgi:CubicO group peptidase (beta-lactamase class C family)